MVPVRPELAACCVLGKRYPANTKRWSNVGLMLGQRRRRLANFNPTLGQRIMFAGYEATLMMRTICSIQT